MVNSIAWLGAWDIFEIARELVFICFEADSEKFKYKVMIFLTNNLVEVVAREIGLYSDPSSVTQSSRDAKPASGN